MSNQISTTKPLTPQESDQLFEGIVLGRTLHQLEEALGIKAERLLSLIRRDEGASLGFKEAREVSAFVIEDEVTEKLRDNAAAPASAVQNNALKLWADHMHWVAERRNAAIYSGKAPVNVSVPIQIVTSLDLGQQKSIEGVYELTANSITEVPIADLPLDTLQNRGILPGSTSAGKESGPEPRTAADGEAKQPKTKENIGSGRPREHSIPPRKVRASVAGHQHTASSKISGATPRKTRPRAIRDDAKGAKAEGAAP